MSLWIGLFQILCAIMIVPIHSIYFTLKSHLNEYDPLVLLVSENNEIYPLPPVRIIIHKLRRNEVEFRVPEDYHLLLACPAESPAEILMSKSQEQQLLFEKPFQTNLSCKTPLSPSFHVLNTDEGNNCGKDEEGIIYFIGYRVRFKSRSQNSWGNNYSQNQMMEKYVNLYEFCYSEEKGTMFTIHPLAKRNGYQIDNISQTQFEKLKLNRIFKNKNINELCKNKKSDESIYQLVPYNDMMLTTWKNGTLFDINTFQVNNVIKEYLDEINNVFQKFAARISDSLTIYSGIIRSSDSTCYWKASKRSMTGGKEEIAILLYDTKSKSVKPQPPCEYNEHICRSFDLGILLDTIPNFFCCFVNESFAKHFGLVIKRNSEVVWGYRDSSRDSLSGNGDHSDTYRSVVDYDALAAVAVTPLLVNPTYADNSSGDSDDCSDNGCFRGGGRGGSDGRGSRRSTWSSGAGGGYDAGGGAVGGGD